MMMQAEIRGRNRAWTVWTSDESSAPMKVPLYDQEGMFKEWLTVGAPNAAGKMVERHGGPFSTIEEAEEYARYLGYPEAKVVRSMTREEALAKARATRQRRGVT
jgi:hypothetical protein